MSANLRGASRALRFLYSLVLLSTLTAAAFINYDNCLASDRNPLLLKYNPLFFDAKFERESPYTLTVTIYGNVSGQQYVGPYPPPDSPHWRNDSEVNGKIPATGDENVNTTLFADFRVLSYTAYNAQASSFCPHLVNSSCPLGPSFFANGSNPYDLPAFQLSHGFGSPYEFSTLVPTISIISGDKNEPQLACISASITPYLGDPVVNLITYLPAAILIMKALATLAAAIWSPWGSFDIFRWSSNYGRDEDLLRLVTPGFGDCLQYIQFFTLMGSLTLQFPGFFQPAVSQMSWSLLLFNSSFVTHGPGTQSLMDGIYVTNGTYGFDTMQELIGMTAADDVWACMAVWLLVIAVAVVVLCQFGFLARWIYRAASKTTEEDLRRKNLPFTLGNMIRLLFNFFILPIVALSLFQLVISPHSKPILVAFAAVLLAILILGAGWILRVIFTAKPRTFLFDDMPTVLLYGPLYNTYSDSAAPFALVPVLITFMRGVAFGAAQPSGTGQIVILAVCEIILILALNTFRPFQNQTSMNAYHTFFSVVRLITVLLCIAFIPELGITEAPKGWIGYTILLLHGCVLVFGFFLNSAQTLIEVAARSLGLAGREAQTGAMRGSILSWRMLKKRKARPPITNRASTASNTAMLRTSHGDEVPSWPAVRRSRSISASSQQLLSQAGLNPNANRLSGMDHSTEPGVSPSLEQDGAVAGGFSFITGKNDLMKNDETFYRPPRARKNTIDALNPASKNRSIGSGADFPYSDAAQQAKRGSTGSPAPAYLRTRTESDGEIPRTDYAVREVDQYYRGQALSDQPTRKLKTGPADPEGPAANAQSWFQRLIFGVKGNKKKEQGKGFEVVRSSRMPPEMQPQEDVGQDAVEMQTSPPMHAEPYRDLPTDGQQDDRRVSAMTERPVSPLTEEERNRPRLVSFGSEDVDGAGPRFSAISRISQPPAHRSIRPESDTIGQMQIVAAVVPNIDHDVNDDHSAQPSGRPSDVTSPEVEETRFHSRLSEIPPSLGPIELGIGLDLPSRFNSRRSVDLDQATTSHDDSHTGDGWLRDVNELTWSHNHNGPPQSSGNASAAEPENFYPWMQPSPSVPPRSTLRGNSGNHTPRVGTPRGATPTAPTHSRGPSNVSGGAVENFDFNNFDVDPSGTEPAGFSGSNNSYFLSAHDDEEGLTSRTSTVRNTSHHRAADSITRNSFGANAALQATSAEIMGSSPPEHEETGRYLR